MPGMVMATIMGMGTTMVTIMITAIITTVTTTTSTITGINTIMTTEGLSKLLAWLSPSFPVGAFSYSHGLEWAIEAGDIADRATLEGWLADLLEHGAGRSDAIFLLHAHRAFAAADDVALREVAELAAAFQPTKERALESHSQGAAFLTTIEAAWPAPGLERLR